MKVTVFPSSEISVFSTVAFSTVGVWLDIYSIPSGSSSVIVIVLPLYLLSLLADVRIIEYSYSFVFQSGSAEVSTLDIVADLETVKSGCLTGFLESP